MAAPVIVRGRLIDHVQLVVNDLQANRRFYAAVFGVLGIDGPAKRSADAIRITF